MSVISSGLRLQVPIQFTQSLDQLPTRECAAASFLNLIDGRPEGQVGLDDGGLDGGNYL